MEKIVNPTASAKYFKKLLSDLNDESRIKRLREDFQDIVGLAKVILCCDWSQFTEYQLENIFLTFHNFLDIDSEPKVSGLEEEQVNKISTIKSNLLYIKEVIKCGYQLENSD